MRVKYQVSLVCVQFKGVGHHLNINEWNQPAATSGPIRPVLANIECRPDPLLCLAN